jgi:hypothetical protein
MKSLKIIAVIVIILGLVGIGVGGTFLGLGFSKNHQVAETLREQKVTVGLEADSIAQGNVVDNLTEATVAAQVLGEHLKNIAPSYTDLLAGGRFDPANTRHLSYAQGMNVQSYFFTSVIAFGLAQSVMANGLFMMAAGLALILGGFGFYKIANKLATTGRG